MFQSFAFVQLLISLVHSELTCNATYNEKWRPQYHFSPPCGWINDPCGLVSLDDTHHLYFQYDPNNLTPRSIHWGHAKSKDLLHWQNLPVAIYPYDNIQPFTGSAIDDKSHLTGLQSSLETKVLIAIYTLRQTFENDSYEETQGIAYSNDKGVTFANYVQNPIIQNPGFTDFRDPKILHYANKYILSIAAGDRIVFYESKSLLSWTKLSEFGLNYGRHGGVWECPDLIPMKYKTKTVWILLVSINPGGINGGSATQYFVGHFNGKRFKSYNSPNKVLWLDYGPDCYAGVTWTGTTQYLCWMNNWKYGSKVPTYPWRGQMSIARNLQIHKAKHGFILASTPISLDSLTDKEPPLNFVPRTTVITSSVPLLLKKVMKHSLYEIRLKIDLNNLKKNDHFKVCLFNGVEESACFVHFMRNNSFLMDRSKSGQTNFSESFTLYANSKRMTSSRMMDWTMLVDTSSIEVFIDGGLTVMTKLVFPTTHYDSLSLHLYAKRNLSTIVLLEAKFTPLRSIWNKL